MFCGVSKNTELPIGPTVVVVSWTVLPPGPEKGGVKESYVVNELTVNPAPPLKPMKCALASWAASTSPKAMAQTAGRSLPRRAVVRHRFLRFKPPMTFRAGRKLVGQVEGDHTVIFDLQRFILRVRPVRAALQAFHLEEPGPFAGSDRLKLVMQP